MFNHYLLTVDLAPLPARIHAYVITDKPQGDMLFEHIFNRMFDEAHKNFDKLIGEPRGHWPLSIVLSTKLDPKTDSIEMIQRVIVADQPEAKAMFKRKIKKFLVAIFVTSDRHPDHEALWRLH